jgi:hypothetical protein
MSTTRQRSTKRSTRAPTQAAPGKTVPHVLNARFVVMTVERWEATFPNPSRPVALPSRFIRGISSLVFELPLRPERGTALCHFDTPQVLINWRALHRHHRPAVRSRGAHEPATCRTRGRQAERGAELFRTDRLSCTFLGFHGETPARPLSVSVQMARIAFSFPS